ncbi:TetR/AcrR family transcriptional regulator [Vibrio mediterranei]|jgi:AcrR family transcriptional regulator|uniref:TetR/AcrR family transcriptional regulator n=1 Tax=Vibrio mediterranei TaxID=689 RepID=UPI001EFC4519|nr:TetR/AcrR family transcriptional regulator [Vibrio mediterranei]MCG9625334.1 TetR/AcrR family transcriptional regulator [Vibrio mediterranei]
MPKIVDHDQRRKDIALNATSVFLEHGYKNVGMRQLCELLGMSKSAVYHYYKSKDELFKAATEAMVNVDADALTGQPVSQGATNEQKIENFIAIFEQMTPRFFKEMQLVTDYIEVIGETKVASDPSMMLANQKYLDLLGHYVSEKNKQALYTLILGLLNHQIMIGKPLDKEYISYMIKEHLS